MKPSAVVHLLQKAASTGDEYYRGGASPEQLADLAKALRYPIPAQLRAWLQVCNGAGGLHGTIYGTGTPTPDINIEWRLDEEPDWRAKRWIPVADDGFGNDYILDASHRHTDQDAIYFVESVVDDQELAWVAASNMASLVRFLLERDVLNSPGAELWPFDREYVTSKDPDVATVREPALLPWNVG